MASTLCWAPSELVHTTVVPTGIVSSAGENWKLAMSTATWAAAATVVVVAPAAPTVVVTPTTVVGTVVVAPGAVVVTAGTVTTGNGSSVAMARLSANALDAAVNAMATPTIAA